MMKNSKTKAKTIMIMLVILILVLMASTSYAFWQLTFRQTGTNEITTGCFKLEFQDENPINLGDALPITDSDGKKLTPYTVKVTNICDTLVKYQVNLDILNTTTLNNSSYIKSQFQDSEPVALSSLEEVTPTVENANRSYKLETGVLSKLGTKTFNIRLWMNETTPSTMDAMNKTFASKVVINIIREADYYTEDILNGADPVLKEGLVPVKIASNGDITKANTSEKWYNYENKEWANAVILKDKTVEYADGASIPEANIESYFVWIPRYRYKIFSDTKYSSLATTTYNKVQTIDVEFESIDVTPSTGIKKDSWLTHPAFTSFNSNGVWVGKFETSKSNETWDNVRNAEGVQIKPNAASWRGIQVGNAFYTSYYYRRDLDSHLIKNSEWGAVAYLQHSKYGSQKSVRINNNSNYLTGYASAKETTCGYNGSNSTCNQYGTSTNITLSYNTSTGYLASTTGNISGIYDMSGGSWEYVMGIMADASGSLLTGSNNSNMSGFSGGYGEGGNLTTGYSWPKEKYYDKYAYNASYSDFSKGHLGDATVEMGPFIKSSDVPKLGQINSWYMAHADFVYPSAPWFVRGGDYTFGTDAGIYCFGGVSGAVYNNAGFRIVLTF